MSLIVARKAEGQLCIVSDTKLTYPDHDVKREKARPSDGVMKTIVLNADISVSFAGEVIPAEQAVKENQIKGIKNTK